MMDVHEFRTLLDFGMVVILWLVQLVIYPGFLSCDREKLVEWHKRYTQRVAWVIIPIMFSQLPLVAWLAWRDYSWNGAAALSCVTLCWVLTFGISVPLHRRIDAGDTSTETVRRLVQTNWPRTILWSAAFFLGL